MEIEQRKMLFTFACMPARILMAVAVFVLPLELIPFVSSALGVIGASFATLYTFNLRMNAPEGGGRTWWNRLRPLHSASYLVAACLLVVENRRAAALVLTLDAMIGLIAWRTNHARE